MAPDAALRPRALTVFELRVGAARLGARATAAVGERVGRVVLVHGLGEHSGRYGGVMARFARRGFDVAAFDLEGHGTSTGRRGDATFEGTYDALETLLAAVGKRFGESPTVVYGHSLGGALALGFARDRRPALAGVVAASPGLRPARPVPAVKRWFGRLIEPIAPRATLPNGLELDGLSRDPAVIDAYRADPLVHDRVSVRLGLEILERGADLIESAASIDVPLLPMHGTADRLTSCAATEALARGAGVEPTLWPGCYHELHHEPEAPAVLDHAATWIAARVGA